MPTRGDLPQISRPKKIPAIRRRWVAFFVKLFACSSLRSLSLPSIFRGYPFSRALSNEDGPTRRRSIARIRSTVSSRSLESVSRRSIHSIGMLISVRVAARIGQSSCKSARMRNAVDLFLPDSLSTASIPARKRTNRISIAVRVDAANRNLWSVYISLASGECVIMFTSQPSRRWP